MVGNAELLTLFYTGVNESPSGVFFNFNTVMVRIHSYTLNKVLGFIRPSAFDIRYYSKLPHKFP